MKSAIEFIEDSPVSEVNLNSFKDELKDIRIMDFMKTLRSINIKGSFKIEGQNLFFIKVMPYVS